jgi:hypothetical protein
VNNVDDALRALVARGFKMVNAPGYTINGVVIPFTLLYTFAWEAPFIDVVHVRAEDDVTAVRAVADGEKYSLFDPGNIVWKSRDGGNLVEVVDDLLGLPAPGERGAPTRQVRTPSRLDAPDETRPPSPLLPTLPMVS